MTKRAYRKALIRFMTANKIENLEDLLSLPVPDIETMIIDYLLALQKDDLSSSFINISLSAFKHVLSMNDVRINKEKIGKFLGEYKKKNTDRGYTTAELRSIVDACHLRLKVVVLTMVTVVCRYSLISTYLVYAISIHYASRIL
jgi:hypothetical protein